MQAFKYFPACFLEWIYPVHEGNLHPCLCQWLWHQSALWVFCFYQSKRSRFILFYLYFLLSNELFIHECEPFRLFSLSIFLLGFTVLFCRSFLYIQGVNLLLVLDFVNNLLSFLLTLSIAFSIKQKSLIFMFWVFWPVAYSS